MALSVKINEKGRLASVRIAGKELCAAEGELFCLRLRDRAGAATVLSYADASQCRVGEGEAEFSRFAIPGLTVKVSFREKAGEWIWHTRVTGIPEGLVAEWVDLPRPVLSPLEENGGERGRGVLLPYNEGVLVTDVLRRERGRGNFCFRDPEYPPVGNHAVFPNMICSQFIAYVGEREGLYFGVHDGARGMKGIDYVPYENGVGLRVRVFCGGDFGEDYQTEFETVWAEIGGGWEAAAERYRSWLEKNLPVKMKKVADNSALPAWYAENPLVVTYPVRGEHDKDVMNPNALYPYTNALPLLEEIRRRTGRKLMVLLMHWEGTAPWAPPYVWPPYGDKEDFDAFARALREKGDLLGVYCSGFSYTLQSCFVEDYNCEERFEREGLSRGMCVGPEGQVQISKICTGQRKGYDLCPASPVGEAIVWEAYEPLLESGLDYAQVLDQNHGGSQYYCYAKDHGHPPVPGSWMTERMQGLLGRFNDKGKGMLLGCESAAAEPFLGNLLFSDNRYELNYRMGRPVPTYAYLYHEYLHNFMGNQCGCAVINDGSNTLNYRIAYSFCAGDCMTLVMKPNGQFMTQWAGRDPGLCPDRDEVLGFVKNLGDCFDRCLGESFSRARMIPALAVDCDRPAVFPCQEGDLALPLLPTSAWETEEGKHIQIVANPWGEAVTCRVGGKELTVPAMDAVVLEI